MVVDDIEKRIDFKWWNLPEIKPEKLVYSILLSCLNAAELSKAYENRYLPSFYTDLGRDMIAELITREVLGDDKK